MFENSGILADEIFYIILDNQIIKMNLQDFTYINYLIPNPFGAYYEIYNCENGFLVYGELELVLLDKQFEEQWRYCTPDILFGENCLQLNEEYISFKDFYGMNWDAYWDAITGLIALPDELTLRGWNI